MGLLQDQFGISDSGQRSGPVQPQAGAILMGLPDDLSQLLSRISPHELTLITQLRPPLIAPRYSVWWWQRLLNALQEGDIEELRVILDHAGLIEDCDPTFDPS